MAKQYCIVDFEYMETEPDSFPFVYNNGRRNGLRIAYDIEVFFTDSAYGRGITIFDSESEAEKFRNKMHGMRRYKVVDADPVLLYIAEQKLKHI